MKYIASLNNPDISVTAETSQVSMGPLGPVHLPAGDVRKHVRTALESSALEVGVKTLCAVAVEELSVSWFAKETMGIITPRLTAITTTTAVVIKDTKRMSFGWQYILWPFGDAFVSSRKLVWFTTAANVFQNARS